MGKKLWLPLLAVLIMGRLSASEAVLIGEGKQPQVAVDPTGNVFLVYGSKTAIFCAGSSDGGKTFSAPVKIADEEGLSLGMRRGPRIGATAKSVVITAISGKRGTERHGQLLAWYSRDGGNTWSKVDKPINSVAQSAREGLHSLAAGPDDKFYVTWLDLRSNKTEVWGACSSDGGATWGNESRIYSAPEGGTCPCCHPSVVWSAKGDINVLFRNDINGKKDMYLCRSTDGGKSFSPASRLGTGTWKLDACPMDGGSIATDAEGKVMTSWRRQDKLFLSAPGQPERELGVGMQPTIAAGPGGYFAAWISKRSGALSVLVPGSAPSVLTETGSDPVIAADINGKGPVLIVWEAKDGVRASVLSARK